MTQKHTPTPWDINAYNLTSIIKVKPGPDSKGNTYVDGRHSVKIANVMGEDDMTWGERHANAAFIVRACNAHDDLVAVLEYAKERIASYVGLPVTECIGGEFQPINDALAKAKGDA